jgi:acetyl-CoA carboxylase biotin carboxyl carrier protein
VTIDEIRELIHLANEGNVAELEVQRGENRVRVRRAGFASPQEFVGGPPVVPAAIPVTAPSAPAPPAAAPPPAVESAKGAAAAQAAPNHDLVFVKSPIVGTFYESPSPGAPPFVRIGEHVRPGKVLCIIESMKLMNEIEAEIAGVVESKLVMNGQPVEYGEALFGIRAV